MRNKHILVFFVLMMPYFVFSATQRYKRSITWKGFQNISISETESIQILKFESSINEFNNDFLPVYKERIAISSFNSEFNIELVNKIFEPISEEDINKLQGMERISDEIFIESHLSIDVKKPFASISFIPIRKNIITGFYERLIAFEIEISVDENTKPMYQPKSSSYKNNSVLVTGDWYKIAVSNTGVYKMTYTEMQNMGIVVNSIDPRKIRLYGNGGGMLPEDPTKFRYDDLEENAIVVVGENDGSFDSGDYVLFYGESPHSWEYKESDQKLHKYLHLYSDYTYYFINTDMGEGKRMQTTASSTLEPTYTSSKYNDGYHHEKEEENLIGSGRAWYGEKFDFNTEVTEEISIPYINTNSKVYFKASVAARSDKLSSFDFYLNNEKILEIQVETITSSSYTGYYAKAGADTTYFYAPGTEFNIKIVYNKSLSTSVGWLDYFTLNVVRNLALNSGIVSFRDLNTADSVLITEYDISNATTATIVWNVTNPENVNIVETDYSNSHVNFRIESDELQEFIAFDGSSFKSVQFVEKIENQNLHSLPEYDMIIISHPLFVEEANRLADFHQNYDNLSVKVIELAKIYNEFSSGAQDITAIRDFLKMFYEKETTGNELKYLLLFGDASYDYKDRVENNTNFVPTWESPQSLNPVSSYVKDDFFGLLDDIPNDDMIDLGIGRFVVSTEAQAKSAVDKVIHYSTNTENVMGDWRNIVCLIADDEDGNLHFRDAEELAEQIDTLNKILNIEKIYLDAYQQVSTSSGETYPDVTEALNSRVDRGALIINYVGHGGEAGLAHERILKISDINNWSNIDNMPVFITATCEFSRFDDPKRISAGEFIFLNPDGAGISLFTTSRATFAGANSTLNKNFYKYALKKIDGEYCRMGDVIRLAKNESGNTVNTHKFILLGDPALKFAFPEHDVITATINNISFPEDTATIKALSEVTITGEMQDYQGNKLTNFNGILYPTVFDKPALYSTLGNDPASNQTTFEMQNNALYKGKASIKNGEWSFTFIAPKDIAYQYGNGKLSYYAKSGNIDAAGYFTDFIVGGYNENAEPDNKGPEIALYLNDESFISGGLTDENPVLLANVFDKNGINTVGSGIGHDIMATLDNSKNYILNNYYESEIDNYQKGTITYPFFNLSHGLHTLSLKVWDVYNNPSTAFIEFIVAESSEMALNYLMNYPNPFHYSTTFSFEHNQADEQINVKIQIYSLTGQLVKTLNDVYFSGGYKYKSAKWHGTDDNGNELKEGIYVYRVLVKNINGTVSQEKSKLVIHR